MYRLGRTPSERIVLSVASEARSMRRKGVRRVPVVGAENELVGIVTMDDVLTILSEELSLLVGAIDSQGKRERLMRQ